jgi:DNA topoisomerase I
MSASNTTNHAVATQDDMPKSLIIVESPAKAKTINKYLGKNFKVEATVGHIKNLPSKELGVDVENGFVPKYVRIRGKAEVIKKLQKEAAIASDVYIATDPDREGEAIAAHIAFELQKQTAGKDVYRVLFNEITKSGIKQAMDNPRSIDTKMVDAQQARRVLDRIVGYKVSPFLWKTIYRGLSAGRVQSVALKFICDREAEIEAFDITEYWSVTGEFKTPEDEQLHAKLAKIDGKDPEIPDETAASELVKDIKKQKFAVKDILKKEVNRKPNPPFITSTLQQEAANRLKYGTKRTMMIAQQLYEGIEIGEEGAVGLVTYMRTDSTRISGEALANVQEHIEKVFGKEYLPDSPRVYKSKANAQDAHEAIRPTSLEYSPAKVKNYLTRDQYALYELIWKRFVASQMASAVLDQTTVVVEGGPYIFRGVGSVYKFRGFLQVYDEFANASQEVNEEEAIIPKKLKEKDDLEFATIDPHQHFTKPPPRFSESSLVRELESKGIGRPSTFALIVSTVLERGYVDRKERKLFATVLGRDVNKILQEYFQTLFNETFTARMEGELDTIATGEASYTKVMEEFYTSFSNLLENTSAEDAKLVEETDELCDKCGKPMIIRWGRNGKFMACSGYPECKNAKPLPEDAERMKIDEPCPDCGNALILKQSRYGKFIGCTNYPDCKFIRPFTLGIQCPKCKEGEIVERFTKTKRTFYGCSIYPNCDFVSWDKPEPTACPSCKNDYLLRKYSQKKGEYLRCPECKDEFSLDLSPLDAMQIVA